MHLTGHKTFLLLAIVCARADVLFAQSTFLKMYNRGNSGFAVREVPGGYAVAGGTDHYFNWHWFQLSPPATTDIHLFKTDLDGTLLWERVIGGPFSRSIARWMEPTSDGGYIIAGYDSQEKFWPPDSNNAVLLKTDGLGTVLWSRVFDSGTDELAQCVQQTGDGGYIISGFHDSAPISATGSTSILLIKTNAAGVTEWAGKIPLAIRDLITGQPFTYVVKQTSDGGYVIVGTSIGALALGVYVVRTNALGAVVWANVYEHDATALRHSTGLDIIEHVNGDLLIAGSMDKAQPMETNYPYLLRIGSGGELITAKFFQTMPPLFFQSGFSSVRPTTTGGFFFSGMGGYGEFGDQAQLLKTDAGLNTIWSRVYSWDGMATMGARNGRPTTDGGYIFTGKRQFTGTVLMKTDAFGLIPCKTPNVLSPLEPFISVQDVTPVLMPLSIGAPIAFNSTSPLADSTTVCPVAQSTLPIELGSFSATVEAVHRVLLDWTTLSEHNNDHFLLERSADGINFEEAGRVAGAGSTTGTSHYSFTDEHAMDLPVSYYRLSQIDTDGRSSRAALTSAIPGQADLELIGAHAGDGGRSIIVELSSDLSGPLHITIRDLSGKTAASTHQVVDRGRNRLRLGQVISIEGCYLITLTNARTSVTGKVVF